METPKEKLKQCDICKMCPRLEGTNKCESCYSVIRHFLEQDPEFKGKLLPDLRKKQETLEEITEQIQKFHYLLNIIYLVCLLLISVCFS